MRIKHFQMRGVSNTIGLGIGSTGSRCISPCFLTASRLREGIERLQDKVSEREKRLSASLASSENIAARAHALQGSLAAAASTTALPSDGELDRLLCSPGSVLIPIEHSIRTRHAACQLWTQLECLAIRLRYAPPLATAPLRLGRPTYTKPVARSAQYRHARQRGTLHENPKVWIGRYRRSIGSIAQQDTKRQRFRWYQGASKLGFRSCPLVDISTYIPHLLCIIPYASRYEYDHD